MNGFGKTVETGRTKVPHPIWMRLKDTIVFLGFWEILNNADFKPTDFEGLEDLGSLIIT